MRRQIILAVVALATAAVLTGCGDPGSSSSTSHTLDSPSPPVAAPPQLPAGFGEQDLQQLLPPVTLLEDLWGTELEDETRSDLSQLWEGSDPRKLDLAGFRTRTYRESGATPGGTSATPAGGYVALTLFTATQDAERFAATAPVFGAEDLPDADSYGEPIELGAFADEGHGYTYTEDGDDVFGLAYLRMDRMIVEIALLGQAKEDYHADLEAVAGSIREAIDRTPG